MNKSAPAIMGPLLACLLLSLLASLPVYSQFKTDEPIKIDNNNNNNNDSTKTALGQSAPYTLFDKKLAKEEDDDNNKTVLLRNVLFRLAPNGTQLRSAGQLASTDERLPPAAWMLIGPNGTIMGHRLNLNIAKLLENLSNNNFTSEIRLDNEDPTRIVNITIAAAPSSVQSHHHHHHPDSSNSLDEMLLEELILDAMPTSWNRTSAAGLDFMPVFRDNHRQFESDRNNRTTGLRPRPPQVTSNDQLVTMITPPPIRAAMEVVAENYTIRKVSEEANVFSLRLLHQVNIEKLGSGNVVQAPFAVYQGLALLMTGASGDTAKELDKVLLGIQSPYENQKLTHDQDKNRLLASLSDILRQLHSSATNHLRGSLLVSNDEGGHQQQTSSASAFAGGSQEQHLIVANNLLFLPSAYEISQEFKQYLANYFNQTATLTKIEVGSTESIQTINGWIRRATSGLVATIIDKRNTFDETNVMSLLSTSWLQQEWQDEFRKVVSPTRSSIRLKLGHPPITVGRSASFRAETLAGDKRANLLEFVDDNKQSHFVEYIQSEPSKNIHVYRANLGNGPPVELVTVPFRDSNHRLITITPLPGAIPANISLSLLHQQQQQQKQATEGASPPIETLPDSSSLSKLIAFMSNHPRKVMRSIWNIIAPDIITKQTLQSIQQARQKNITIDERLVEANVIPLVQLSIPSLRTGSDSSLSAALNHIGVVNTFDPYQANFIGINGHPFNYYQLHLSNVIFKTTFNLNERGINYDRTIRTLESMRIYPNVRQQTGNSQKSNDADTTFKLEFIDDVKLNKPFVYMICDMRTKLILYTGTLRNPAQSY